MRALLSILAVLSLLSPTLSQAEAPSAAPNAQPGGAIVYLAVVVERDGSISNATVAKSCGNAVLDWVALDKAREMKVEPSKIEGAPVRSQKVIAIAVTPREPAAPAKPVQHIALPKLQHT